MKVKSRNATLAALTLLACSALIRALLFVNYPPVPYPDTVAYTQLANQIANLNFADYDGSRTPLYPLMLLACHMDFDIARAVQMALGVATTMILFAMILRQTDNIRISFIGGLWYSFSLGMMFWENCILTESLCTFLLVLSFLLMQKCFRADFNPRYCAATGFVVSLACLARPIMLASAVVMLLWICRGSVSLKIRGTAKAKRIIAAIIPMMLLIGGWSMFNKATVGYPVLTSLVGYNLSQHSGAYIEYAPDRYSVIRTIYLKHRKEEIRQNGNQSETIWRARREMQKATGLSFVALSRELTRLSITLFAQHPILYFSGVFKAWWKFWTIRECWLFMEPRCCIWAHRLLCVVWLVQERVHLPINIGFLVIGATYLAGSLRRRGSFPVHFPALVIMVVIVTSVGQALVTNSSDSERFEAPFEPLVIFSILVALRHLAMRWTGSSAR